MKDNIEVFDYANHIMRELKTGILLTTQAHDRVNSMTISWGTLGIEWGKPMFTVFVREHRFTKQLLDESGDFTINIPFGEYDKKILGICGTKSGLDTDKVKELGLTLIPSDSVSAPAIKELPLTLECKVVYKNPQNAHEITDENKKKHYPQDVESTFHGSNKDFHTAYYGEIVNAYILK